MLLPVSADTQVMEAWVVRERQLITEAIARCPCGPTGCEDCAPMAALLWRDDDEES